MEDNIICDNDKSDEDILDDCEKEMQEMEQRKNVKRPRESEESSEAGFITFSRKSKRLIRSTSGDNNNCDTPENMTELLSDESYEVCLFSPRILLKQMALAKFLKNENITNVIKIKYKSPYRVFIKFSNKAQAENLVSNKKLIDMDIRAQFTRYSNLSYGIIRGVDLDISEMELLENLNATSEIISAKRMKRMSYENKWIESETIRLCFRSASIPQMIEAYGFKFTVEKYVFPVTQCSRCWKYGHIRKFCSLNKDICPKCGKEHTNCETEVFTCSNCKGPHMSLDKICPLFTKEKMIRKIMSEKNLTYKKSLDLYLMNEKDITLREETQNVPITETLKNISQPLISTNRSYSSVLQTTAEVHKSNDCQEKKNNFPSGATQRIDTGKSKKREKAKNQREYNLEQNLIDSEVRSNNEEIEEEVSKEDMNKRRELQFNMWNLIFKLKNIIMSENNFEAKIIMVLRALFEECRCITKLCSGRGFVEYLLSLFDE